MFPHSCSQLQVVATNSALTELRDTEFVKAGAIESQATPTNVRKRIEGVSNMVGVKLGMGTFDEATARKCFQYGE